MVRPLIRYLRTLAGLSHYGLFDHGVIRLTSWYPRSTSLPLGGPAQTQMTALGPRTRHNEQPLLIDSSSPSSPCDLEEPNLDRYRIPSVHVRQRLALGCPQP